MNKLILSILSAMFLAQFNGASATVYEWSSSSHEIFVGDYNNDGLEDIYLKALPTPEDVTIPYDININLDLVLNIRDAVLINGNGSYSVIYDPPYDSLLSVSWGQGAEYAADYVDFDNDGYNDLLVNTNTPGSEYIVILAVNSEIGLVIDDYFSNPGTNANSDPENIPARGSAVQPATKGAGSSLSGDFSVSQSGKPNYVVPLVTLPTRGNVRPEISLAYSGENGDSILGVGWYVQGLSEISRCKTSIVDDGYINGVNFNSSDKYCLNGQRLVNISGSYGASGTIYRTQNETFTRIESRGVRGGSPEYFIVRKSTGEIEEYGASDNVYNSTKLSTNGAMAVSWKVNKITDREGNYATYYYNRDTSNGKHYIDKVVDAKGRIQFNYEARTDFTKSYANSSLSQLSVRLSNITSYFGSTAVRRYDLEYSYGGATGRSRLDRVRECVSSTCTPYTTFGWDAGTEQVRFSEKAYATDSSSYPTGTVDHQHYLLADANGDGKSDLIWLYRNGNNLGRVLYLANSSGTGFTRTSQDIESGYNVNAIADTDHRYMSGDVNGDGKDDLVWAARAENTLYRVVYLANSTGTGFTSQGYEVDAYGDLSGYGDASYSLADVNGDGRSDLVWSFINDNTQAFTTAVYLSRADSSGRVALGKTSYSVDTDYILRYFENHKVLTGDVNGDGRADLTWMFTYSDRLYRIVYLTNPNGTGFNKLSVQGDAIDVQADDIRYIAGDVNGDQKSDIIYTYKLANSNGHVVYLSSTLGTSHVKKDSKVLSENALNHQHRQYASADLNGDGRNDLVYTYTEGADFGWKSYTANMDGEGFTLQQQQVLADTDPTHQNHAYQLADVNGDGKTDMVWTYNSSTGVLSRTLYTLPASHPDHIISVTDGLGISTDIHYDYLANGAGSFFHKGTGAQYPFRDDNGLSYVVTRTETDNGIGGKHRFDYTYTEPKTHLTGRGFSGFESRTITDNETGFITTEGYWQQYPLIGAKHSAVVTKANGAAVEKSYYHWGDYESGYGTHFPYLKDQLAIKYDLTSGGSILASLTKNTYDLQHGNVTDNVISIGRGYSGGIDAAFNPDGTFSAGSLVGLEQTINTDSTYSNNTSATWRLGFLSGRTVTYSAPGEANRIIRSSYTPYSSDSFLTRTENQYIGSGISLTTTYGRDSYGNITLATISGDGIETRQSSTTAYNYGLYPDNLTNDKGHTEFFEYDTHTGLLEQHRDINGQITDTLYDNFGRLILTKKRNGSEIKTVYASCASGCPSNAEYKATTTDTHAASALSGSAEETEYFDGLHRLLRTEVRSFNGSIIRVDKQYDARGRLDRQTVPYINGSETAQWIDYAYDDLNRVTSTIHPDGGEITTTYSSNGNYVTRESTDIKTVLPDAGSQIISSLVERNAQGQMKRVVDGESVVTEYRYNAQGQMRWIRVDNNAQTEITIGTDVAGNRTQLIDPDVGTIDYHYDALGLLRQVLHTDGATVNTSYDTLNRIKSRTDTLGSEVTTSSWIYDLAANGLGEVSMVVGPDFVKNYEYDALSREKQNATRLFGEETGQSFHYRYDPFSRIETMEYPDGFKVNTGYNSYGYQSDITNADTAKSYWQANSADKWGNITNASYGNGITTQRGFDNQNGFLDYIRTGTSALPTHIQNYNYGFDTVGNLRSRQSSAGYYAENLLENFTYDDLYRLKSATTTGLSSGTRTLDYDYDNLGNITYKSDVSDVDGYSYGQNGGGVHALSSITHSSVTNDYHYDTRGNMITAGNRTIGYTAFNKPENITAAGLDTAMLYGPDRELIHQLTQNNSRLTDSKYYGNGSYEVITEGTTTRRKAYIGDFMVHTSITVEGGTDSEETRYLHKDHINSTDAITDEAGSQISRMAFAPYGSRRDDQWLQPSADYNTALPDLTFETTANGFTGHKQLDASGFIHMGGRMYDPAAGRFLSPDTYIQFPELSQSFNRYSYVLNNPLSHTDESGEFLISGTILVATIAWRAYSAYDAVTNGVENVKTLVDENASGAEKTAAALDLGSRVLGTKKITDAVGIVYNKAKKVVKKKPNTPDAKDAGKKLEGSVPKAKGKDANTQRKDGEKSGDGKKSEGGDGAENAPKSVDTVSDTSRQALRKAKEANGIPKSAQPDRTIKPNTPEGNQLGLDSRNVKQYEYTNSSGQKISIRQDRAAGYDQGGVGDQKTHFNAGPAGQKLKQHHYYGD